MEFRRAGYAIVFVILLCALADWNSEEKRKRAAQSYPPRRYMSIGHLTKAKQACNHCRKELVARKEVTEDSDLYVTDEAIDNSKSLPLKRSVIKAFEVLPPQMKKTLLDCLSKNRPSSANWFIRCLDTHRRQLVSNSDKPEHYLPVSAPFPTSTAPSMYSHSRHFLAMPPKPMPTQPVTVDPFLVPSGFKLPPPSPSVTVEHAQEKAGINPVQLILIVAAAVLCLSVLVTAILLCYKKKGEEESGSPVVSKHDERSSPALSQNTTTTSLSEQPPSVGNSGHKELETQDEIVIASENKEFGSKNRGSIVIGTELPDSIPPLKPPPGREVEAAAPAAAPPPPPPSVAAPPPPRPPPPGNAPPPPPPRGGRAPPPPRKPGQKGVASKDSDDGAHKAKLKPFFWDKVAAGPNQAMVWNEISSGSFQFNEEKMESLFGYANTNQNKPQTKEKVPEPTVQYIQIIDKKKAQNLSILLKALSVTTGEVCDALTEGNELSGELISSLLKMAPTQEEEMKLKSYDGDVTQLGPAERFLKSLVSIPFAFRRLECLLFMSNLQEETGGIKEAFSTLEVASTKLKNSRLFLKLLEAVLKTGNRMNDGTYRGGAMAFKLDTLLKLSDVKGTDGKSTLLNFVVQEIIRFEGLRAVRQASGTTHRSVSSVKTEDLDEDSGVDMGEHYRKLGLEVVSGLSNELEDVKRAAIIDADSLISTLSRLGQSLVKSKEFMKNVGEQSDTDGFHTTLAHFLERADGDIKGLLEEEKRIMALVKSTGDYFHGSSGKDEGLRLFVIVRDFLKMLDKVCNEIQEQQKVARAKSIKKDSSSASTASQKQQQASEHHTDDGSSSDGSKDSKKEPFSIMTSAQILQKMLDRYREHMDHESHSDDGDEEDDSDDSSSEKDSSAVASSSKKKHRPSSSDSDDDKFEDFSSKKDSPSVASSSKMQQQLSHSKRDDDSGSDEDEDEDGSKISRSNINSSSLHASSQGLQQSLDRQRRIFSQRTELQFDAASSSDEFEDSDSKQDSSSMLTLSNTQKRTSDDQSSSDGKKDSPLVPISSQTQQQSSDDKSSSDSDKDEPKVSRSIKMSASSKMVQQSLDLHRGLLTGQPDDESSSGKEEEYRGSNSDDKEKNALAHS